MKKHFTILLLLLFTGSIYAGGFQLNEHGAKAMALGGAFTALANDASAVYWNSAGIPYLKGTNFLLGTALVAPSTTFRGVTPSVEKSYMQSQVFTPSHLFITHTLNENFGFGVGITTPFGLGTKWKGDWVGRYLAVETELKTFWVPVTIAWSPSKMISISGGFVYSFADVLITRKNSQHPFEGDANVRLEGDESSAFGYMASIMFKPLDILTIGASFRSEIEYQFEGTAVTTGAQQLLDIKALPNGDVTADLTTPMNIVGGIAVQVIPELMLSADFQWVGWSSYDSLKVNFKDPDFEDLASPREYEDTYIIRFGAEYAINNDVSLLGGIYFDKIPVQPENVNPSLPDSDRLGFSLGVDARIWKQFGLAASYLFIRSSELTVTDSREIYTPFDEGLEDSASRFNGTYNSYANLLSVSLYYNIP